MATDTKTVTQRTGSVQSTIRIPRSLSVRAKIVSAKTGITVNQLFTDGLELRLAQFDKKRTNHAA